MISQPAAANVDIATLTAASERAKLAYRCAAIAYGAQSIEIQQRAPVLLDIAEEAASVGHAYFADRDIPDSHQFKSSIEVLQNRSLDFWSGMSFAMAQRDIVDATGGRQDLEGADLDEVREAIAFEADRALKLNSVFEDSSCEDLLP